MSNINNISREGKWSDSVNNLNQNFIEFESELNEIEGDIQKCKGLFPSLEKLREDYPNPAVGSWAYVGSELPAPLYVYRVNTGWTNTGKTGGGTLDPSEYANSQSLPNGASQLYQITSAWIQSSNGTSWSTAVNKIKINGSTEAYYIRPSSLKFGEEGELLATSTTDPYLKIFQKGSFVSMTIISSDNVSKSYTANTLSWTIDNTFFKKTIDGVTTNRMPVIGDSLRANLYFNSGVNNDVKVCSTYFKFSN